MQIENVELFIEH